MAYRAWIGLVLMFSMAACMGARPGQQRDTDLETEDPKTSNADPDHWMTSCAGDPDSVGDCTVWTCDRIPIEWGHKVHCEGKRNGGGAPPRAPNAGPDGSYSCPAGVQGGSLCPPSRGGTSSRCVRGEQVIKCDSGVVCEHAYYPSEGKCKPCGGASCALEVCTSAVVCGGTGKPGEGCPAGQYWSNELVRCTDCSSRSCEETACQGTSVCAGCPVAGQFHDGISCRACVAPLDCFRSECSQTPACNMSGGGNVVSGNTNRGRNIPGCVQCVPGAQRYCDGPNFCGWGLRSCLPDGTWGPCIEEDDTPRPEGCRRHDIYNEECCERSGQCCEDLYGRFLLGNCAAVCKG